MCFTAFLVKRTFRLFKAIHQQSGWLRLLPVELLYLNLTRMDAASPSSRPLKSPAKTCAGDGMLRPAVRVGVDDESLGFNNQIGRREHKMGIIVLSI